jgi:hypothetical protein
MRPRRWTRPAARLAAPLHLPLALALALAALAVPTPPAVRAAAIAVTGTGTAVANDGVCTLIEAIRAANADAASGSRPGECPAGRGADTIALQPGATYTLTAVNNTRDGPTGLPVVTGPITIEGQGAVVERSRAAGTPAFRVLHVAQGGELTLNRLTVRNGQAPPDFAGGGISNAGTLTLTGGAVSGNSTGSSGGFPRGGGGIANVGTLTLTDSVVSGNTAGGGHYGGPGGGIANEGTLTLAGSAVSGNVAGSALKYSGKGGGIYNVGTLTLTDSTVSGNAAGAGEYEGHGGGIYSCAGIANPATLTLTSSTVSGNTTGDTPGAPGDGGGIYTCGAATLTSSTVSGNATRDFAVDGGVVVRGHGGGIAGGPLTLTNTIIAGNRAGSSATDPTADCSDSGAVASQGHNLVGRGTGCPATGPGDRAVDPAAVFIAALGPLANNGGPTQTHAPLLGGPAVDAGPPAGCPPADQRGLPRPRDGDGDGAAICDIGAVEAQSSTPPAPAGLTRCFLAEGYTGEGFDEYLTILNPNPQAAQLRITYYLNGGAPIVRQRSVPANSRATVAVHDPAQGVGRGREVSVQVESTNGVGVAVERPVYFRYAFGDGGAADGGHIGRCLPAPAAAWSFAEGYTGAGFDEFLTILNPNPDPAPVTITYYLGGGQAPVEKTLTVPASARATVAVHEEALGVGRGKEVAATVATTNPGGVVVERPIYFRYALAGGGGTVDGGSVAAGATATAARWMFAEGYTGAGFDAYLTVLNPNPTAAELRIDYALADGTVRTRALTAAGRARTTVAVHEAAGAGLGRVGAVAATVTATNGVAVLVERPIYFRYAFGDGGAADGGHVAAGAPAAAASWLFAEGYTAAGFDEYLTILNPNPSAAPVTITYYFPIGGPVTRSLTVGATSRATVAVHEEGPGVGRGKEVGARVATTGPGGIVVERPMYFRYGAGIDGGSVALGLASP